MAIEKLDKTNLLYHIRNNLIYGSFSNNIREFDILINKLNQLIDFANTLTPMEKPEAQQPFDPIRNAMFKDTNTMEKPGEEDERKWREHWKQEYKTSQIMPKTIEDAANFSNFAQRVKSAYWRTLDTDSSSIPENELDQVLLLAWDNLPQPTSESGEKGKRDVAVVKTLKAKMPAWYQPPTEDREEEKVRCFGCGSYSGKHMSYCNEEYPVSEPSEETTGERLVRETIEEQQKATPPEKGHGYQYCKTCKDGGFHAVSDEQSEESSATPPEEAPKNITEVLEAFDKKFGHLQDGERYRTNHQSVKSFLRSSITELLEQGKMKLNQSPNGQKDASDIWPRIGGYNTCVEQVNRKLTSMKR